MEIDIMFSLNRMHRDQRYIEEEILFIYGIKSVVGTGLLGEEIPHNIVYIEICGLLWQRPERPG